MLKQYRKKSDMRKRLRTTALKKVKEIIANLAYLAHPKAHAKLQLKTDASATYLGGVLEQIYDDKIKVLGYYSKSLIDNQKHYFTQPMTSNFLVFTQTVNILNISYAT